MEWLIMNKTQNLQSQIARTKEHIAKCKDKLNDLIKTKAPKTLIKFQQEWIAEEEKELDELREKI
jgi:hypothetical protein